MAVRQELKDRIAAMSSQDRVARAVKIFLDPGPVQQAVRMSYLEDCGLTTTEILEAMNQASGGALVASAMGE